MRNKPKKSHPWKKYGKYNGKADKGTMDFADIMREKFTYIKKNNNVHYLPKGTIR